jgi:membrane protease YdiL (CAAX protease family)
VAGPWLGGDVVDAGSLALTGAIGATFVLAGFAAVWRCRPLAPRGAADPSRLVLLSLAAGTALGMANLAANWAIAEWDPRLRALLVQRMAAIGWRSAVVAAPLVEEVAVRLFLMSAIAWVVSRFTDRAGLVFAIALVGSAFVFALLHLARPLPADSMLANSYRALLLVKYTMAGLPLGWIFWRWGLPHSIVCHAAANAAHIAFQGLVF